MLIGYARVSTDDQDTAAQVKALKAAECERTRLPCVDELFPTITRASLDRRDPLPAHISSKLPCPDQCPATPCPRGRNATAFES